MPEFEEITVAPLSGALGAEVSGIDLARPEDAALAEVSRAFLAHQVLIFRDQDLSPSQLVRLAARFGTPSIYPFAEGLPGFPAVTEIVKEPHQTSIFGGMWHSDTTYLPEPPKATLLHAVETPAAGGDTLFANMTLAYEALSAGLRALLDRLEGVNSAALHGAALRGDALRTGSMAAAGPEAGALVATHPAVRLHPETRRRALYVNPSHSVQFAGWTPAESRPLLDFLFAHAARPEFTCRLAWRNGSLALWDNRCSWHRAINDYHGQRRVMRRVSIAGDRPRGPAEG
jgi:taurine dioxygenase